MVIGFAALAAAQTPAPAATVQQAFDGAEARAKAGDWAAALADFRALQARIANARTRAVIEIRIGECLAALGRDGEAAAALRAGAERMPADPALAGLRASAFQSLGLNGERRFDFPQALADYRAAHDAAPDRPARLAALAGMARAGIFVDPAAAAADADAALALLATDPATTKAVRAQYLTLKGRALLNAGQPDKAGIVLTQARTELGGLTQRLDGDDLAARSDSAIAAMRANQPDKAREFLAWSGAGNQRADNLARAVDIDPPACGDIADAAAPHPDDVAVVEFGVADDGGVVGVQPIFASRMGPMIRAFLEAVSAWSWTPEQVAAMKPFFRAAVRVELRCSTTVKRPVASDILKAELNEWMAARGLPEAPGQGMAAVPAARALEAELAIRERRDGPADPKLLPVLAAILDNNAIADDRSAPLAGRAVVIAAGAGAPASAVTWFRIKSALGMGPRQATYRVGAAYRARVLTALGDEPGVRDDARSLAAVRLMVAEADAAAGNGDHARATLRAVVGDRRLTPRDALRVAANVRLASAEAAVGDLPAARTAFEASGLGEMECALVDARPAITKEGFSSSIYPMEAMRWGFEGWSRGEFDIAADGQTRNVRIVIAYPPFVFDDATSAGVKKRRYMQSYRPAGGLGCGGESLRINYRLPR